MISGLFNVGCMHSNCERVSGNVCCGMDWTGTKTGTKPGRWSGMKSNIVTMSIDLLQEGNLNRKIYKQ